MARAWRAKGRTAHPRWPVGSGHRGRKSKPPDTRGPRLPRTPVPGDACAMGDSIIQLASAQTGIAFSGGRAGSGGGSVLGDEAVMHTHLASQSRPLPLDPAWCLVPPPRHPPALRQRGQPPHMVRRKGRQHRLQRPPQPPTRAAYLSGVPQWAPPPRPPPSSPGRHGPAPSWLQVPPPRGPRGPLTQLLTRRAPRGRTGWHGIACGCSWRQGLQLAVGFERGMG